MVPTFAAHDHAAARAALLADGVVVLRDAIPVAPLIQLRDRLLSELPRLLARPDAPFNFHAGNIQQSPPRNRELLVREVLLNEHVIAITAGILPSVKNTFYSGNTALPGDQRQPVHADFGHLWADHISPPFSIVVNVPLVDMGPENGATELWPGTHRINFLVGGGDIAVPAELRERQRAIRPPVQPTVALGSVILRDMRLWHAGMPNRTVQPRPMLAMIHSAGWWPTGEKTPLLASTRDFFAHPVLTTEAEWVESVDHTALDAPYAFTAQAK